MNRSDKETNLSTLDTDLQGDSRRRALRKIAAGGVAGASHKAWLAPVVIGVGLPSHAQASSQCMEVTAAHVTLGTPTVSVDTVFVSITIDHPGGDPIELTSVSASPGTLTPVSGSTLPATFTWEGEAWDVNKACPKEPVNLMVAWSCPSGGVVGNFSTVLSVVDFPGCDGLT